MFNSAGTYTDPDGSANTAAWRMRSFDNGATWPERQEVIGGVWAKPWPFFTEACFLALSDTHFLMSPRITGLHSYEISGIVPPAGLGAPWSNHINGSNVFMESFDGGLTWTSPAMVLDYGDVHAKMIKLADGRLLWSYRSWSRMPLGIRAIMSEDDGQTWDTDHTILLATTDTISGGWQSDVQLPDGTMVTTWGVRSPLAFEVIHWQLPQLSDFHKADTHRDRVINFVDMCIISQQWLNTGLD